MIYKTPASLLTILQAIEVQTSKLTEAVALLGIARNFTLDGRLVGDIGEMLAAQHLELDLNEKPRQGYHGTTCIEGKSYHVQVKCRKATSILNFSRVPQLLVVIIFNENWSRWEIVYNGSGEFIRQEALNQGLQVTAHDLIRRNDVRTTLDSKVSWLRQVASEATSRIAVPLRRQPILLNNERVSS